ncbi:MAG: hypothetical protein CR977_00810 [Gammaproteobacteria bacterium]|nr:MAG: hypothetical protein CR977_00810 [Gammaproteobacteria bacterium]
MSVVFNELPVIWDSKYGGEGYFAGTADGIVTVAGEPAMREIVCFDADTLAIIRKVWSFDNGHYLVPNLSTDHKYLLIARDYKKEYTPHGWDYREPATTLSYAEQQQLLEQWR